MPKEGPWVTDFRANWPAAGARRPSKLRRMETEAVFLETDASGGWRASTGRNQRVPVGDSNGGVAEAMEQLHLAFPDRLVVVRGPKALAISGSYELLLSARQARWDAAERIQQSKLMLGHSAVRLRRSRDVLEGCISWALGIEPPAARAEA